MVALRCLMRGLLPVGHGLVEPRDLPFVPADVRSDPGTGDGFPTTHRVAGPAVGGTAAVRGDSPVRGAGADPAAQRLQRPDVGAVSVRSGQAAPRRPAPIPRVGRPFVVDAGTSAQLSEGITR